MGEPRPVLLLLALQSIALLFLIGWWVWQTPVTRLVMLTRVAEAEHIEARIPLSLDTQARWLVQHRLERLQGMVGTVLLLLVVGSAEGVVRRRHAMYGGFLFKSFVIGTVAIPVAIGGALSYLVLPWPLSQVWYGAGLSGVIGIMGWGLFSGRPYIP